MEISRFSPPISKKSALRGRPLGLPPKIPLGAPPQNPGKKNLKFFLGLNYLNFFNFFFRTTPDPRGSADIFWRTPPRDPPLPLPFLLPFHYLL
jgi:hypothetical protein